MWHFTIGSVVWLLELYEVDGKILTQSHLLEIYDCISWEEKSLTFEMVPSLPYGKSGVSFQHSRPKISICLVKLRYWIETRNIPVVEGLYCNSPGQKQTIMRLSVLVILQNGITQHSTSQWVTLRCAVPSYQ